MRNLLLFLLLLPLLCWAQKDPCRKISRKVERKKGIVTYRSPETKYAYVVKQLKADTAFAILFHFSDDHEHFETYGAAVEFEDGTVITDDNVAVKCAQEKSVFVGGPNSASTTSYGGKYILQGFFRIGSEYTEKFTTSRIARVRLHNTFQNIPKSDASDLKRYISCMVNKN